MHGSAPSGPHWEAYKTLNAMTTMGPSIWLPEGTPDEAFDTLKAGGTPFRVIRSSSLRMRRRSASPPRSPPAK
ncbi:MAG: hypothetical protein F4145_10250 [Boseongicola sp. SB0675_bin_26]|nr:hypothetical protein [Boseongicola sp. SB0675_bin_26]